MPKSRLQKAQYLLDQLIPDTTTRVFLGVAFLITCIAIRLCVSYRADGYRWWAFVFALAAYIPLYAVYKYLVKPSRE